MKNDNILIEHKFPQGDGIEIIPISDVHLGAAEHLSDKWERFCSELLARPNAYITLGGDLINNATKSSVSNVYAETMRPRDQKKRMVELLTPLRDRILAVVPGNHEYRSSKDVDDDITYDICTKLDIEDLYRENIAFIKLRFGNNEKGNGQSNPTYIIALTHGAGGGALTGGSVNKTERFALTLDGCDLLISGHVHKAILTAPAKIKIDAAHNRVYKAPMWNLITSSWLDYGGYAARKLLLPSSDVAQTALIAGNRKHIRIISETR